MIWSMFPKSFRHLDVAQLAGLVREVGVDTTNMVIRDGYWVTRGGLAQETPKFVEAMRNEGLTIHFATTDFAADELAKDPTPLKVMHDSGIRDFRMGWFKMEKDVRGAMERARAVMQRLADVCAKTNVRAIYQLHHDTLVSSPSAAYAIVGGLPAKRIGVELDPGNQSFDGYEDYVRSAHLLGEYLAAVSVKDTGVSHDRSKLDSPDKGWKRDWAPVYEGIVRWDEVAKAMREINFDQTIVMMPHYDHDKPDEQRRKLKREVEYLKRIVGAPAAQSF
jgi:sugar phosphate isomerase/epimerase